MPWPHILRYLVAVTSVVVASIVRVWLDPLFGEKFPYITYMFAIIFVAWHGGAGPSLLTMILGFLSAFYFFASPRSSFAVQGIDAQVGAILYIATSLSSILFSEQMRRAERHARHTTQQLQEHRQKLEREVQERITAEEAHVQLLRRIVSVQEDERRRISRELHDQCGQDLTALRLELKMLENGLKPQTDVRNQFQPVWQHLDHIATELRHLAVKLRPSTLDDLGLTAAVAHHLENWQSLTEIATDFEYRGGDETRLSDEIETALFRVLQEALTNVARHSAARSVNVVLLRDASTVGLIVEDQGCGFDPHPDDPPQPPAGQLGLLGMRERMIAVGGSLEIESAPGAGTTIYARVPLTASVAV